MRRSKLTPPPPLLVSEQVLSYALLGREHPFVPHEVIYIDGKRLGQAPCLAVTKNLFSGALSVCYCDEEWNYLGSGAASKSLASTKRRVDRSYPGSRDRWIDTGTTKRQAMRQLREDNKEFTCSFCGRLPHDVQSVVTAKNACICNICLAELSAELR